ncbi:conjugative transposon protein TraK [Terrimonas sp.]|jgi:conjugative transposon TraK protein|uniref:conjugative transposon protein TraK n=2 Tax=Terrimonas TaxID=296051 RepID=UPI0006BBEF0F|nr:conjugative transposon protein TraK [Terrimonas sp.]MBN8783879.1 conjugative transposon protein TraK [Terrimonas ferruginea]MBN8859327.1 conjugative transposon protein TraK [Sphingobacteriales bacterium]MBN9484599.1 conjugative transposon protein TraK [Bacteroidota bacterium]MBX3255590.1 conjugative transposon protein TraK [Chitinophagaceae bacterium]OJW42260.1 MAG: conjugative transposon protein TraK [Sphingobacteriales bacterium 48-107]OJW81551.1 MAG: conjugative transposon protein TraK 
MFKKMKNIDTAFRHVRSFTLVVIIGCVLICCFALYKSFSLVSQMQSKIYILANGKALEAYASERKDNIPVEAKDHVKTFHKLFFTLDPDDKAITANITKALYLADGSAKRAYDDLKENGYYAGLISGNVNQTIVVDSVAVDINEYPYKFRCYATQSIVRPTSITTRSLVTDGALRNVSRSDNNPHGFLIERWSTIDNRDLKTVSRRQ